MFKYFLWFALLLGASVFVTGQHEKNANNAAEPCEDCAVSTTAHEAEKPNSNLQNSKWYSPGGVLAFQIFGWPNGITVWALFLTMMVIAEQTHHTARAANVANRALVSTLRPKVIIRRVWIHRGTAIPTAGFPDADPWTIEFDVANTGGSIAKISSYSFMLNRYVGRIPIMHFQKSGDSFSLEPGEEKEMAIPVGEELTFILRTIGDVGLQSGYQNTDRLFFHGYLQYADDLGIKRNTCALRHYKGDLDRFQPVDDPEREYAD